MVKYVNKYHITKRMLYTNYDYGGKK